MRIATIDVGTNTVQLLVAEAADSVLSRLHAEERFVRLGEGIDERGRIGSAALDRLLTSLHEHIRTARAYEVEELSVVGTSALRDTANRDEVLDTVRKDVGVSIEILTGPEEATWSFAAACSAFESLRGASLVVDVGGGSTELVLGTIPSGHPPDYPASVTDRVSLEVGCVRLTERCFPSQPSPPEAVETAERTIDEALTTHSLDLEAAPTLIGTAGTATALALVHAGPNTQWDALRGKGFSLSRSEVQHWRKRLLQLTEDEVHALHPAAMDGRADIFPMGVLLLDRIMAHYNREILHISPYELRHGVALRAIATPSTASPNPST